MSSGSNKSFDITNFRENLKRTHAAGILLEKVHATNTVVYEAAEDLVNSRKKLAETKNKMKDLLKEFTQQQSEIMRKKNELEIRTNELHAGVMELQSTDTHTLSNQANRVLKMETWLIEDDIAEARKHINYAEEDLKEDTNDENGRTPASKDDSDMAVDNVPNNSSKENKCCICLEEDVNSVLYPCGHMCTCYSCASELKKREVFPVPKCPVCRLYIMDIIRTYRL